MNRRDFIKIAAGSAVAFQAKASFSNDHFPYTYWEKRGFECTRFDHDILDKGVTVRKTISGYIEFYLNGQRRSPIQLLELGLIKRSSSSGRTVVISFTLPS